MIKPLEYQDLGNGIYCVDTVLYRRRHTALYLIEQEGALACIDNGSSNNIPALLALIDQLGFQREELRYVMPTHVHLDHAGGSGALMAACPNAQLVIHPKGLPHMIEPSRLQEGTIAVYGEQEFMRVYGVLQPIPEPRTHAAADGEAFDLNGRTIRFFDTPGHANHHGCLFDESTGTLFTGDTFGLYYRELFSDAGEVLISPTTPVAFDPDAWFNTLEKIAALSPKCACPTHYGPIEEPLRLIDQLRESIAAHRDIALAEEGRSSEERYDHLCAALAEHYVETYRRHGSQVSREELIESLSLDMGLNAQGLMVWLKRRERTRNS